MIILLAFDDGVSLHSTMYVAKRVAFSEILVLPPGESRDPWQR
jgi:hypothetical protein